jgi:hypothetical protein
MTAQQNCDGLCLRMNGPTMGISRAEPPFGEGTRAPRTVRREARRLDAGVGRACDLAE